MIFSEKQITRWHDTDPKRVVRPSALLMYMQEASNHHMESCGLSLDELRDKKKLAFILSKTRMVLHRPLYAFEEIEVQTWTCKGHGLAIPREYRILKDGEVIAQADTTWGLVDLQSRSLLRSDECDVYAFEDEQPLTLDVPPRFRIPKGISLESVGSRKIVYSDLDYNMHMNNTHYPDMLCDFMPLEDTGRIKSILLSYVSESAYGDELDVKCAYFDGSYYFRTVSKSSEKTCLEAQITLFEE